MSFRRSYVRVKAEFPAKLLYQDKVRDDCLVKDISARGVCIITKGKLDIAERVEMQMQLPFSERVVVKRAKVVWGHLLNDSLCRVGIDFGLDNMIELPDSFFNRTL